MEITGYVQVLIAIHTLTTILLGYSVGKWLGGTRTSSILIGQSVAGILSMLILLKLLAGA